MKDEFLARPRDKFRYTYDFGDSWEHVIELKLATEYFKRPMRAEFVDGAGKCPPEDCGGVPSAPRSGVSSLPASTATHSPFS